MTGDRPPRVALFGGSFDPPHLAHVLAVRHTLETGEVDRVLVVPVFAHAFEKDLVPFEHRVRMTELAMSGIAGAEVSRVEEDLGAPSRTLRTVRALATAHPEWALRLLIGADILSERDRWLGWDEIVSRAPPLVLGRPGVADPSAPSPVLPDISSSRVRDTLRSTAGSRRMSAELAGWVPELVLAYIDEHELYRGE